MKYKHFFLIPLMFLLVVSVVESHFPELHTKVMLDALEKPDPNPSLLKQICRDNLEEFIAGNFIADSSVIFYLTPKARAKYYHGTHSLLAYQRCVQLAGSSEPKRAFCAGWASHLISDITSHSYKTVQGYTPPCISKYWSTNLILHPVCERVIIDDMLEKETEDKKREILSLTVNAFDLVQANPEYIALLNDASGVDLTDAVAIVGANLKKSCPTPELCEPGESYSQIYKQNIKVPWWWYAVPIAGLIALIFGIIISLFFGRTNYKWIIIIILIFLLIPFSIGTYFVLFNKAGFFNFYINSVDKLHFIVKVPDYEYYIEKSTNDILTFLDTGEVKVDGVLVQDATGLSHYEIIDGQTVFIEGPLQRAELKSKILLWIIFFAILGLIIWLFRKMGIRLRK